MASTGPAHHEARLEQLQLEKEQVQAELATTRQQWAELRAELQEVEEEHVRETQQLTEEVHV